MYRRDRVGSFLWGIMLTAKRVGRPPNPPVPTVPEPYDRPEYAERLRVITDALEIGDLAKDVKLYCQKILRRCDLLRATDAKRFPTTGEETVTLLLRAIAETTSGTAALKLPILKAVSSCLRPAWVAKGLALLEAFDQIELIGLHTTLTELGLSDQLDRALFKKLTDILGPPVMTLPPKKPPVRRAMVRPKDVSERTWSEVIALYKPKKRRAKVAA
jgi:hypothetical protein